MAEAQAETGNEMPAFGTDTITIIVGRDGNEETFVMHEAIAAKYSAFIAAATEGGSREAQEHLIRLPEDDPTHFRTFQAFAHTGRIKSPKPSTDSDMQRSVAHLHCLVEKWVLGEKLQASEYEDAVVDACTDWIAARAFFQYRSYIDVYRASAGDSGMRKLHVDIAIYAWTKQYMEDAVKVEGVDDFFRDLAITQHELLKSGSKIDKKPYKQGRTCRYHDHGDKECYRKTFGLEG